MTDSEFEPDDGELDECGPDSCEADECEPEACGPDECESDEGGFQAEDPDLGSSLEEVTRYEQTMQSIQLLEATHNFPCNIMVKVIGRTEDGFLGRIIAALRLVQQLDEDPPYRSRETPNGQHIAVTFEPFVETAEEVLVIYDHIRTVQGVVMVM